MFHDRACGGEPETGRVIASTDMEEDKEMLGTILLIILVLALLGSLPTWPYSGGWGYYPSGGLGLVVLVLVILLVMGRL